jgi:chromosome segregation ATPase
MSKNIKDMIEGIESHEKEKAELQNKLDRLREMIEKQKTVISEKENIIEKQKVKITRMYDIPEDVLELKELVGSQRAMINEKDQALEFAKGDAAEARKELDLVKRQIFPTQRKVEDAYEAIGNLKAELAEKNSTIVVKNDLIKNLENKVREVQAFADKLQEEQVKLLSEIDQKWKAEIEKLKKEHFDEKKDLTSKIAELDTFLMDTKLTSTEATSEAKDLKSRFQEIRDRYDDLVNKVEKYRDQKRIAEEELRKLQEKMNGYRKFQEENIKKITYFNKLTNLMEQEPQFKAFLILEKVGSMTIDDLRKALGSPIVLVRKIVQKLQDSDLLEIDEQGKIIVKKVEVS